MRSIAARFTSSETRRDSFAASRRLMALVVVLGTFASCAERALPVPEALDCAAVSFDLTAPSEACETVDRCDLTGTLADGRSVRESCTQGGCALFVDEVQVCACPPARLDFSQVCADGLPTCAGWLVNWSTIGFCASG